jgi:hypothetical protein
MRNLFPARAARRIPPERLVGDQVSELRQASVEAGVRPSITPFFPLLGFRSGSGQRH